MKALDNVSLEIEDQEFVTIVGPSGCGKTTFLRILDGLIEPTSGEILIGDEPVVGSGQNRGMVFQSFNLFPWRTVKSNIEFGLECRGDNKNERQELAQEYLELVGLKGFGNSYPHELSGGMQQRVGLARALAIDPEILLMDEPFGALDAQTREVMQTELLKIWSRNQKTVLFITHDIDEAIYLSDRIIVFTDRPGKIDIIEEVPIERPRYDRDVHSLDIFNELHDRIWDTLMGNEQTEVTV
ncbi:ABC transporter ATP-binding protein [Haloferax sp. DFSO52]|uniref:ABC transporter ATP-binding protein n=1 Tax=Haloferax sp. DFSO52 TaxID=3388505 RepID=UPI003A8A1E9E